MAEPEGKEQYDLEMALVTDAIKDRKAKRILLQFPEGLKGRAVGVRDTIEEATGAEVMIYAGTCFGACDLPDIRDIDIDIIVQFGHSEMGDVKCSVPVMFVEARSAIDVLPVVKMALPRLGHRVGLITTAQHIHELGKVKDFLQENEKNVRIGNGSKRVPNRGQVLGCNLTSATSIERDVDCYLYIGSGNFHPIGVAMATARDVICADPYVNQVRGVAELRDRMLRQRHGTISRAQEAESFGILVGTKPGQERMALALSLEKLGKKHGKKTAVMLLNEFSPMKLKPFPFEAYVSTACPRIALDDYGMYPMPLLTPLEFRIVLGESRWEDYRFDEFP